MQFPCNAIYSLSLSLSTPNVGSTNLCCILLFIYLIFLKFWSCHGNSGEDRLWPRAGRDRVIKLFPGFKSTVLFEIITCNMFVPAFCTAKSVLASVHENIKSMQLLAAKKTRTEKIPAPKLSLDFETNIHR